jgi:hypothetical protein
MSRLDDNLRQLEEQMNEIKESLDKFSRSGKIVYYHGRGDSHNFWVYPISYELISKWNTHLPAHIYCNNSVSDGYLDVKYIIQDVKLYQYKCLGHVSMDDFKEARIEWMRENMTYSNGDIKAEFRELENFRCDKETQTSVDSDIEFKALPKADDKTFKNDMILGGIISFVIILITVSKEWPCLLGLCSFGPFGPFGPSGPSGPSGPVGLLTSGKELVVWNSTS